MIEIDARSLKDDPDYVRCPRCRNYHRMLMNHEGLCDRCCAVLVELGHESADAIRASFAAQRERYRAKV